jgi:hypothetical protein
MFRIWLSKTIGDAERDHVTKETTGCPRSIHPTFLLDSQHSQSDEDVRSVARSKAPW